MRFRYAFFRHRILALVIAQRDLKKAMSALHDQLFLSNYKTLNLFFSVPDWWKQRCSIYCGNNPTIHAWHCERISTSSALPTARRWFLYEQGIDITDWHSLLTKSSEQSESLVVFTQRVKQMNAANSVVVDCTGIEPAGPALSSVFGSKCFPCNTKQDRQYKILYKFYQQLRESAQRHGVQFRTAQTSAPLCPSSNRFRTLFTTAIPSRRLKRALLGTLSFIFNQFKAGTLFMYSGDRSTKARI